MLSKKLYNSYNSNRTETDFSFVISNEILLLTQAKETLLTKLN